MKTEPEITTESNWFERKKVALLTTVSLVLSLVALILTKQHFIPGIWPGDQGGFFGPGFAWFIIAFLVMIYSAANLALLRKFWLVLIVLAAFFGPIFLRSPSGSWKFRYRVEKDSYHNAVKTGARFGDQYSEQVDDRELIYWRWMSWGLDNSVGILYDPEDRLNMNDEDDRKSFNEVTHGVIFGIKKIEPRWYYVTHS